MESRFIIAMVASLLVIMGFYYFFPQQQPKKAVEEKTVVAEKKGEMIKEIQPVKKAKPIAAPVEREIVVESDLYKAVLTGKGGTIKSWELKKYAANGKGLVQLIPAKEEDVVYPLSLELEGADLNNATFTTDGKGFRLDQYKNKETITFSYIGQDGLKIEKRLTFYNDNYRIDMDLHAEGVKKTLHLSLGTDFGIYNKVGGSYASHVGPVVSVDGKLKNDAPKKEGESLQYQGKIKWTAMEDKYFIASIIPKEEIENAVIKKGKGEGFNTLIKIPETGAIKRSFMLYAGPKEFDRLQSFRAGMEDNIGFGWFWFIGLPLFQVMKWLYKIVGNYGVVIILITVIVKIIFAPLTHKSYKSMKAMQKLQPKIAALQEKFKADKQKLNIEMMNLYKAHKANPVSGCLPMVIQIPVFIALYNVLSNAIEFRHAPFYWWIKDLSAMDPYYIMPIAMGISMLIQQWMTPSTATDPLQAKMMYAMPIIFTFMFLSFPSGLVIYWLVNNVLSIAQQGVTNRLLTPKAEGS
ncbi:MAG: membrane protein insertase YidC [Nitrospirota bacterium]